MLVTGREKLERMRDGRVVYIGAERIDDVTAHPAFRNGARTIAALYDLKADPAKRDLFTFEDNGERIGLSSYDQHLAASANGTVFHASLALSAKSALAFWPMCTAIVIFVGAFASAWRFARDRRVPDHGRLAAANGLISLGTLVLASGALPS